MFIQPNLYVAKIALTNSKIINVKSMNWGDADWSVSKDPIAQIYFNNKQSAIDFITQISKL